MSFTSRLGALTRHLVQEIVPGIAEVQNGEINQRLGRS